MTKLTMKIAWRNALVQSIKDLQENIRTKRPTQYGPMNNTGEAANSLLYRWNDDVEAEVYSSMPGRNYNYIWNLEWGRKPGKRPPTGPILEWVKSRNIGTSESEQNSIAFLIARKIGQKGTLLHQKGTGSGIIRDVANADYLRQNFLEPALRELRKTVNEEFKQI